MPLDEETIATAKRVWQLNTMMNVPVLDACDLEDLDKNAYYRAKRAHEDDWEDDRYFPEDVLERVEALEEHVEEKLDPWPNMVMGNHDRIKELREDVEELEESLTREIEELKRDIGLLREQQGEYVTEAYVRNAQAGTRSAIYEELEDEVDRLEGELETVGDLEERIGELESSSAGEQSLG